MSCPICGVSSGGQFCVACGRPLTAALPATATATAVSTREREQPARTFDDRAQDEPSVELTPPAAEAAPVQTESAPWLGLITVVVGIVAVAVAVVMLASRGIGPFGVQQPAPPVTQAVGAPVSSYRASSTAADSRPDAIGDKDPATAWHSDGNGEGQWIEIRLDRHVEIDHLLVWNGDQRSADSFRATDRVREVQIVFPEDGKKYTATFLDRPTNFRVDVPDPPRARRIRIKVLSTYGAAGQVALSEVEALVNGSATPAE
jgi:hypothetical protein